jgi:hypothetical protein
MNPRLSLTGMLILTFACTGGGNICPVGGITGESSEGSGEGSETTATNGSGYFTTASATSVGGITQGSTAVIGEPGSGPGDEPINVSLHVLGSGVGGATTAVGGSAGSGSTAAGSGSGDVAGCEY